jgi:hypothetical protein
MKIRSNEIIVAIVLLGLVALLGYAYRVAKPPEEDGIVFLPSGRTTGPQPRPSGPQPHLEASEAGHDFGTIEPDKALEHAFSINNTGEATLNIEGFNTSCGCVSLELSSQEIEPGGAAELMATIDPQHYRGKSPRVKAYIYSNDPDKRLTTLLVSAEITPEFVIEPETIDFGTIEKGKGASQTVRLRQTWRDPVEITGVESSSDSVSAFYSETTPSAGDESGPGGAQYEIEVRLKPEAAGGVLNTDVLVRTNIKRQEAVRLPVRAFVIGGVYTTPELLFFAARSPEESLGAIDVYGDTQFGLAEIESDIEGVIWKRATPGLQHRHRIVGALQPGAEPGERVGSVTLKLTRASPAQVVVPVAGVVLEKDDTE